MARKVKVYVSAPIRQGDTFANVAKALDIFNELIDLGYAPYLPHVTVFAHMRKARPIDEWLAYDFEWIPTCDVLLRVPGPSEGCDREAALAEDMGLPVYGSVDELKRATNNWTGLP